MENYDKFMFRYNDINIDYNNINNIILDKNKIIQIKPLVDNLVYEHFSNKKTSNGDGVAYDDNIDNLFIKNINFIEKDYIGLSRIDAYPMFATKLGYFEYKFLLRSEKIKRFLKEIG